MTHTKKANATAVTNLRIAPTDRAAIAAAAALEHRSMANYMIVAALERVARHVGRVPYSNAPAR